MRGLGDIVHLLLQPLQSILRRFGVKVGGQGCGCAKRRQMLNKAVRFNKTKYTK